MMRGVMNSSQIVRSNRERQANRPAKITKSAPPPIRDWETFTATQLADRLGVNLVSIHRLIRKGLRCRYIFRKPNISGRDYRKFVEQGDPEPCQNDAA